MLYKGRTRPGPDDIIFSTEPGVKDDSTILGVGNFRDCLGVHTVCVHSLLYKYTHEKAKTNNEEHMHKTETKQFKQNVSLSFVPNMFIRTD